MNYDSLAKHFGTTIIGLSINNSTNSHIKYQLIFKVSKIVLIVPKLTGNIFVFLDHNRIIEVAPKFLDFIHKK